MSASRETHQGSGLPTSAPGPVISSQHMRGGTDRFMSDTLTRHLLFERIFPLLPVRSGAASYQEVELNEVYLSCRAVLLNVAVSRDISGAVNGILDLVDLITQSKALVAQENVNLDTVHSVLILVRLLSDLLEYYWEADGKDGLGLYVDSSHSSFERQRTYFKSFVVGFSTHRASLHTRRPQKLTPECAERLIQSCIRMKCNTGTIKLLRNMSGHLHASRSVAFSHVLPEYQALIARLENPILLEKTDLTIEYIMRFIAAANRDQYDSAIRHRILTPLAIKHTATELGVVEYIEMFGCLFFTERSIPHYLRLLRKITFAMKRTVFLALLLYNFSKSFIFWVMARPKEYIQLYRKLIEADNRPDSDSDAMKDISNLVSSLFDDIHSTFNVSSILTSTANHHADGRSASTSNNSDTSFGKLQSVPMAQQLSQSLHHHTFSVHSTSKNASSDGGHSSDNNRLTPVSTSNSIGSHPLAQPSLTVNTKYPNPAIGLNFDISQSSTPSQTPSSAQLNPYSVASTPLGIDRTEQFPLASSRKPNKLEEVKSEPQQRATSGKSSTMKNSGAFAKQSTIKETRTFSDSSSYVPIPDNESTNESTDFENETDNKTEFNAKINDYYLENVLELYSTFNDSELLSNMAVLRFLIILSFLDPTTIPEMNALSFKGLVEVSDVVSDDDIDADNSSTLSRRRTMSSSGEKEKEKLQSFRQLAHGLKKITSLQMPSRKSKQGKFFIQIIALVNGFQTSTDTTLIDAIRSLLSFMTVSASVSLHDDMMPCVLLTKRFYHLLGQNLDVGKNWNSVTNHHISHCRNKYPMISRRLKLEFFAAAVQLDADEFLEHLQLDEELKDLNLKKLCIYTEGFRVSLHLLNKDETRRKSVKNLSKFFQALFSVTADTLLAAFTAFSPKVKMIINDILSGLILEKFETKRIALLKLEKGESTTVDETRKEADRNTIQDERGNYWDIYGVLPKIGDGIDDNTFFSKEAVTSSAPMMKSKSMAQSSSDDSFHILMPSAERLSSQNHIVPDIEAPSPSAASLGSRMNASALKMDASDTQSSIVVSATPDVEAASTPNIFTSPGQISLRSESNGAKPTISPLLRASLNAGQNSPSTRNRNVSHSSSTDELNIYNNDARKIMMNVFSIFKRVSNYFISPVDETLDAIWDSGNFRTVIKPIFVALLDPNPLLQNSAESFMDILILYISDYTDFTDSSLFGRHFLLCSYAITLFCTGLSDTSVTNKKRKLLLGIVVKVLMARSRLIKTATKLNLIDQVIFIDESTSPLVITSLGEALVMCLICNEDNVPKLLKIGFRELDQIMKFYEENINPVDRTCIFNTKFIQEMATSKYTSSGSVAFLRRLKNNIVEFVTRPDILILESFDSMYERWYNFSTSKYLDQQELTDFRSLAGILASLSGVLFSFGDDPTTGFKEFPYLLEVRPLLLKKVRYFIAKQCEWLNYPDLLTRENSRDILCIELHPLAYSFLFESLNEKIQGLKNVSFDENTNNLTYLLLEQVIIIMRTVLKRDDDDQPLLAFSNGIVDAITDLIIIIEKIPHESVLYYKSIIQISKMFLSIESSENSLAIKNHILLKNRWVSIIVSWFKATITRDYDLENLAKPHREMDLESRDADFLFIDTSIESAKALAYLTRGIPLITNYSNTLEDSGRSEIATFGNYFSILLKGLEKSTNSERYPVSLKHKMNILNENIIVALTNLSNSNVEVSLKYSLPMGYSENKNIRIAFLKVFIDIVTNYSLLTSKDDSKKIKIMDKLLLLLMKYPILTYKASLVCPASETDEYAACLVKAFETRNASHIVIDELIKDEIADAARYPDVLRRNSCATRALSLYAKSKGSTYLTDILRQPLIDLDEKMEWFDIERLAPDANDVDIQVNAFFKYLEMIIDKIANSTDNFPPELIHICQTIFNSVKLKFPENTYISVGSFVFLRFLGPALVTPDSEDILAYCDSRSRRSYITLAKVIQQMANGTDGYTKWTALQGYSDRLKKCKDKIFTFLKDICSSEKPLDIKVRYDGEPIRYDYNFFHKIIYLYDYDLRAQILKDVNSIQDLKVAKETFTLLDNILGVMGQPQMKLRNEIPRYVKDNIDRYPQLYEFMNRHGYRLSQADTDSEITYIHESLSQDGTPILTLIFNKIGLQICEIEMLVYKIIQIYARVWTSKYYLVLDCTEFAIDTVEFNKLGNMLATLLPNIALQNCLKLYYINTTEAFMDDWIQIQNTGHPVTFYDIPHVFLNTNSDGNTIKSLKLSNSSLEVCQNVRVSIHDIQLFDESTQKYMPIKLKLGDVYFQVLNETPKVYTVPDTEITFAMKFNDVYEVADIESVYVSANTTSPTEFTVAFYDGNYLTFSTAKYLEIVKMFYYAQSKLQSESYNPSDAAISLGGSAYNTKEEKEKNEIICHLCLIILVGLFYDDDTVKHTSYNLMVATQEAFNLNFGTKFYHCAEIYIPEDTTSFLTIVTKSLCLSSPQLTPYIWKYMVEGLANSVIKHESVPTIICCLSLWVPTIYEYVYLSDLEDGPELVSKIIRTLIKLTVSDTSFTTLYLQQIWYRIALDGRLTKIIVDEILNHALERDSENKEWEKVTVLLTCFPTIEIAAQIVKRFIAIIRSFLPSLKLESTTKGWSEITILSKLSISLFFETPLLCQMYLSELLFIISILIDIGPIELRLSLHKLLMNTCHSLTLNKSLSDEQRTHLQKLSSNFSRQKIALMSGYPMDSTKSIINFSSPSLVSKFSTLEHFVGNILEIMECDAPTEAAQWKTRYKKHLMNCIFTHHSFLSARAMMILGMMGQKSTSEILCRDLLVETMKVFATPILTDETLTLTVAHTFTYSKLVLGIDPSLTLLKQLFWFSTTILESPYQVQFESGMLFMINTLKCLYKAHFKDPSVNRTLPDILMDARQFSDSLLQDLETIAGVTWTTANFPHILIGLIMRGLSIPVLKAVSMDCLKSLFEYSYLESERDVTTKTFFCYLFTIYLLFTPEPFTHAVQEAKLGDDMIMLDDNNEIPAPLAEWLASDHSCSNIALYQGALLFSSNIADDGCKHRFALIMRFLLKKNPVCLFRFYVPTRNELRRISTLEQNYQTVLVAFDIIGLLVTFPEFDELETYYEESLESLRKRGLTMISKIDIFDNGAGGDTPYIIQDNYGKVLYERKRLLTMILSRMTCYV
ncbi:GTPase-activating protein [Maudiozyma humilis]|uniref:GTPase-activating protein n=1 Tax=Maudiozyma humilis TaxID=51915 RepID=A0AAV5S0T3_MAUHU|nr:GTPase-activating protein [Kazachstania humilis]